MDLKIYWAVLCLCASVCAIYEPEGRCGETRCLGVEYECIDDRCYCAPGFIPNHFQARCVKCPGLGEKCYGQCCSNPYANDTVRCWQGMCQHCYDAYGEWICRDNIKEILLISSAQVAMGAALVLGIIATLILLYKLCAATNIRPLGNRSNTTGSRLSIGSLQLYIEERLRDAPPRYTRGAPAGTAVYPATTYINNGFVHDSSIPPPSYSEVVKTEEQNTALHI